MKDLLETLKNVPRGIKLYSPLCGELTFNKITNDSDYCIECEASNGKLIIFDKFGRYYSKLEGECILFPSKDQRDWIEFTEFNPFDKVLVRERNTDPWDISYFGYFDGMYYVCSNGFQYENCIHIMKIQNIFWEQTNLVIKNLLVFMLD